MLIIKGTILGAAIALLFRGIPWLLGRYMARQADREFMRQMEIDR